MPPDDDEDASDLPRAVQSTVTAASAPVMSAAPKVAVAPLARPSVPTPVPGVAVPNAPTATVSAIPSNPNLAMSAAPSALVASATRSTSGHARLSLQVNEAGCIAYVFPRSDEPERFGNESALMRCATSCNLELPYGEYTIRVETAEGVRSYGELALRSARWVQVAPARQVVRDLGFTLGVVGIVSTVLGTALLADGICDTCTTAARNVGGAFGLGLGIPMTAIGWSLYYIHRSASVDERVLAQPDVASRWQVQVARLPDGAAVSARLWF